LSDLKRLLRRTFSAVLLFFQSPALACAMNPYLIWMIPPFGAYVLLVSPWSPFLWFEETRWLVMRNITIPYVAIVGRILALLGVTVFLLSFIQFLRHRRKGLITRGLYSVVRHPQYFGLIVGVFGFSLMNLRPASLIMWITLVFGYVLLADNEERDLEKKYGEKFLLYRQKVPFIFPVQTPKFIKQAVRFPKSKTRRYLAVLCIYITTLSLVMILCYVSIPEPPPVFRSS